MYAMPGNKRQYALHACCRRRRSRGCQSGRILLRMARAVLLALTGRARQAATPRRAQLSVPRTPQTGKSPTGAARFSLACMWYTCLAGRLAAPYGVLGPSLLCSHCHRLACWSQLTLLHHCFGCYQLQPGMHGAGVVHTVWRLIQRQGWITQQQAAGCWVGGKVAKTASHLLSLEPTAHHHGCGAQMQARSWVQRLCEPTCLLQCLLSREGC